MEILASPEEVENKINELYCTGKASLKDGYAPFCKHIFVPNWTETKNQIVKITPENANLIKYFTIKNIV